MASSINATKPTTGSPTTQSVRDNFSAAKDEINGLLRSSLDVVTTTGTGTAYSANFSNNVAKVEGARIIVKAHTASTGAATLNVDGTGASSILNLDGTSMYSGAIAGTNHYLDLIYNSSNNSWVLLNPKPTVIPATFPQSKIVNLTTDLASKLASSSYTAADVKAKLLTVDGSGSGLDADTVDGVHASSFVQDSDTTQSLSSNGWVKLPNGLIIQWGLATSVAEGTVKYVNYNTNFATSVYAINATPRSISATNNYEADKYSVGVYSYSNSQFRMMSEGTSAGTLSIYWMAIGK